CLVTDMQRLVEKLNAAFGREHDAHLHAFGGRIALDDLESDLRMHVVVLAMLTHPLVGLRAHLDARPAAVGLEAGDDFPGKITGRMQMRVMLAAKRSIQLL